MLSGCQPLLCNFLFNCTNRPTEEGMMGQKASRQPDFWGIEKNNWSSCITSYMDTCTHVHTAVVSPRRLVRAAVEPPPAQRLRRPFSAHVDIFLSFNHQTLRELHSPAAPSSLNTATFYQSAHRLHPPFHLCSLVIQNLSLHFVHTTL